MRIALGILVGAALMAGVAQASPKDANRFTPTVVQLLKSKQCNEDEYRAVLTRRPNPRVTVNDPLWVICVAVDRRGEAWRVAR